MIFVKWGDIKMSTIGKNIKNFRKQKKLTQKKLAELTGLNEVTIRSYEADKYRPKYDNLKKLARALGVQTHQLAYDHDDGYTLKNIAYSDGTTVTLSQVLYDVTQNDDNVIDSINTVMSKRLNENFNLRDIIENTVVLNPNSSHDQAIFIDLLCYVFTDHTIRHYLECGFYNTPISQENIDNESEEDLMVLDALEYDENYKKYEIQIVDIFCSLNENGVKKIVEFAEMIRKIPEYQKE